MAVGTLELTYRLVGDYLFMNLTLNEPPDAKPLGHYGRMRREQRPLVLLQNASVRNAVPSPAGD
jgi:hypothetical protein